MRCYLVCFAILSSLLLSTQLQAADAPTKIKPVMILSGKDSAIEKPLSERCCSADELQAVWKKHQDGDNRHDCPTVDFDSFMVIAIFEGKCEGGTWIAVIEVVEDSQAIRLRVHIGEGQTGVVENGQEAQPESEADRLKQITHNYAFVVLPASKKAVVIEVRHNLTDPPQWEEQKRFAAVTKK